MLLVTLSAFRFCVSVNSKHSQCACRQSLTCVWTTWPTHKIFLTAVTLPFPFVDCFYFNVSFSIFIYLLIKTCLIKVTAQTRKLSASQAALNRWTATDKRWERKAVSWGSVVTHLVTICVTNSWALALKGPRDSRADLYFTILYVIDWHCCSTCMIQTVMWHWLWTFFNSLTPSVAICVQLL